jgi:very-short-patch-repair endonuclease
MRAVVTFDDDWVPAAAFWGAFTAEHAYAHGMTRAQVRHRIARGRWRRVAGVALAQTREPESVRLRAAAASLTWPDAVVCLGTAAALHGIPVADEGVVHAWIPTRRAPRDGLVPHVFELPARDVMGMGPVKLTTRARTVADCLGRLPADDALDLLAWASSRQLVDADRLRTWIAEHPRSWGNAGRRRALARLESGAMSVAEDLLHEVLRRAGIEGWVGGVRLREILGVWAVADAYFPDVRLVVEVDGRWSHGDGRFQQDRTRQNALVAAGCTVLRYTWQDLTRRPAWVADQIRAVRASLRAAGPEMSSLRS